MTSLGRLRRRLSSLRAIDPDRGLAAAEFDRAVREVNVFARLTPAMKLRIAERLLTD